MEIDENLDWKRHIQAVMNKISKGNYLLWRHGNKLTIPMKKTLYESFIRCHLLLSSDEYFRIPSNTCFSNTWRRYSKFEYFRIPFLKNIRFSNTNTNTFE